jgi:hypothetical protein
MNTNEFLHKLRWIGIFVLVIIITYAFLSLCNWSFFLKDWNGFSRFVLGMMGIAIFFKFFYGD